MEITFASYAGPTLSMHTELLCLCSVDLGLPTSQPWEVLGDFW